VKKVVDVEEDSDDEDPLNLRNMPRGSGGCVWCMCVCVCDITRLFRPLLHAPFTAALLLLYWCLTASLLLLYCCFTAALLLRQW
jgi:hypothetical protein